MKEKKRGMGMRLCMIQILLSCTISGCSDTSTEEIQVDDPFIEVQAIPEDSKENAEEIINICIDLYKKAAEENKIADLETIRSIVNCLGENGYPAVDSRNQINMTDPEKVVEFCEKVDAQEEAEITILEVSYLGGFVKYDLHTKDGNVDVVRSYYKYENGDIQREVTGSYQAEYWNYTEEGYLMFSGVWFSEELYVLTLSGAEEHTALRVQPLDETYRELSRKYLRPQVLVRSCDNPHVHLYVLVAAYSGKFPFLKHTQDFCLGRKAHVTDFIQEQCSAISLLELSLMLLDGRSEGSLFVAKQFTFNQFGWYGGAVYLDVRHGASAALLMKASGYQFLA